MSKHWFIAHLIEKFTKGKSFGIDVGVGNNNWKEFKHCNMIDIDKSLNQRPDLVLDLEKFLPFEDNVFDVVIAINSLNYVENARQLLSEINRVMKTGAPIVCIVDNEKSKNEPYVWEQRYLERILKVTGFKLILSKSFKDSFYAKWYNRTSVYGFAVAQKIDLVTEKHTKLCYKCGKPLEKKFNIESSTGKPYHQLCPQKKVFRKKVRSHDIKTTHPYY